MKAFFENPAQLVGAPLLAIGALGLAVAAVALLFSGPAQVTTAGPVQRRGVAQPALDDFIGVIAIIGVMTAIEFALFAFGIQTSVFIGILFGMTVVKIALAVMFFVHLKVDSRMFTNAFLAMYAVVASAAVVIGSVIVGNLV
jgi:heme/copper-type cytochrome/quinol oxidase subunit 4